MNLLKLASLEPVDRASFRGTPGLLRRLDYDQPTLVKFCCSVENLFAGNAVWKCG
jgi:hypothetical protein